MLPWPPYYNEVVPPESSTSQWSSTPSMDPSSGLVVQDACFTEWEYYEQYYWQYSSPSHCSQTPVHFAPRWEKCRFAAVLMGWSLLTLA
eukprot:4889548-Amphidinium_carterae.1